MDGPYRLINEFHAHDGPVRSLLLTESNYIVSGCQSNNPNVRIWLINDKGEFEEKESSSPIFHDHWVTALTSLPSGVILSYPDGAIVTGCYDSLIRLFSLSGELILKLSGHSKGVISFSWTISHLLLSGSWDGTARIWDLNQQGLCVSVLTPHENGVNVLGLTNGLIATTSTGESVNNKPANFQLRFWDPSTGSQVSSSIKDHDGSIRSLSTLPSINGFFTTSNDGTIRVRTIDGVSVSQLVHPLQDDGSPPFVLNCKALLPYSESNLVSCSEDGNVVVWSNLSLLQAIPHPSCVWCVLPINSQGDFITGDSEGVIRYFSKNATLTSLDTSIQLTNQLINRVIEERKKRESGPSSEDLSKAAKWEQSSQHLGKSEGQVMLFNKNNVLIAAQWSIASSTWIEVGQVSGKANQGQINGISFDHVFPVEIDTPSGPRDLQLGYNNGENPFVAAQRFIDTYELSQGYLQQIADWILQRTAQLSSPAIDLSGNSNSLSTPSTVTSKPSFTRIIRVFLIFDEIPGSFKTKAISKIEEFNNEIAISSTVQSLSVNDIAALNSLIKVLSETSYYHSSKILVGHLKPLLHILGWDHSKTFPAYDILRLVAIHPEGAQVLSSSDIFNQLSDYLLSFTTIPYESLSIATVLTSTRLIINLFRQQVSRNALLVRGDVIITVIAIGRQTHEKSRPIRQSLVSLLTNLSIVFGQNIEIDVVNILPYFVSTIEALIIFERNGQIDITRLLIQLLGTSLTSTTYYSVIKTAVLNSKLLLDELSHIQHNELTSSIHEIQRLLE